MAFTKINAAGIGTTETVTVDGLTVINDGSFGGNLTVSGVLTYEDVTNVDSVGLITARNGIVVGSGITLSKDGDIFATGITTISENLKVGSGVTISPDGDGFFTGVITATSYSGIDLSDVTGATGDFSIADKIVHTGDTNTAIRFPSADTVTVETGGSERARVDSSGLVGLGTATTRAQLDVRKDSGNVIALFEGSNAAQNHRVRIDASGASSTTGLSISNSNSNNQTSLYHSGGNNNMVVMGGQTAGAEPTAGTTVATFASGGDVTVNTGNLIMGTSGKGISFSATSDVAGMTSELLDDYEEGNFTPILQNGNNGYRFQYGFYIKVGNAVHFTAFIETSSTPPSSNIAIGGLPFTSRNDSNANTYVFPMLSNRTSFGTSGGLYARFYMATNDNFATLYYPVNSSSSNFETVNADQMNAANASNVWMSGTYFTE